MSGIKHGGDLHEARRRFPEAPEPWIDLSTGINPQTYPFAPPPLEAFARLPSPHEVRDLEAVAAGRYGVADPARVAAVPGSQAPIQSLPRLRKRGIVAVLGPTYAEHGRAWRQAGHAVFEAGSLAEALSRSPDVVVAVNPNNPDGRVLDRGELLQAAATLSRRGGWLVIDEAFADLEPAVSLADTAQPGIVILRSLGKAYGLAGLRLGFAIADPALATRIRADLGPWAVSGPALAIGRQALLDRQWLARQALELQDSMAKLERLLAKSGFTMVGGTRLFRLVRHPDAKRQLERLARAGIWTRDFPENAGLLRFGNLVSQDFVRVSEALREN